MHACVQVRNENNQQAVQAHVIFWSSFLSQNSIVLSRNPGQLRTSYICIQKGRRLTSLHFLQMIVERLLLLMVASFTSIRSLEQSLVVVNCTWPCANSSSVCAVDDFGVSCKKAGPQQYVSYAFGSVFNVL